MSMTLKFKVDNKTLTTDENGKLKLKLSPDANQGLSFDENGNLVANPADGGVEGIYNTGGNAIGPTGVEADEELPIIGLNSTVSRHKKYTGDYIIFRYNNDGPVISAFTNGSISDQCIAYYMIHNNNT